MLKKVFFYFLSFKPDKPQKVEKVRPIEAKSVVYKQKLCFN